MACICKIKTKHMRIRIKKNKARKVINSLWDSIDMGDLLIFESRPSSIGMLDLIINCERKFATTIENILKQFKDELDFINTWDTKSPLSMLKAEIQDSHTHMKKCNFHRECLSCLGSDSHY